jgi:hypothetical protein
VEVHPQLNEESRELNMESTHSPDPDAPDAPSGRATPKPITAASGTLSSVSVPGSGNLPPLDRGTLETLRVQQDYQQLVSKQPGFISVALMKPPAEAWFRVHNDESNRATVLVMVHEDSLHCVSKAVAAAVPKFAYPAELYLCSTREGTFFIWPISIRRYSKGKRNDWHVSAQRAAWEGMNRWIRMEPNYESKRYDISYPKVHFPDPVWPAKSFTELFDVAFKDKIITDPDDSIIRRLLGYE